MTASTTCTFLVTKKNQPVQLQSQPKWGCPPSTGSKEGKERQRLQPPGLQCVDGIQALTQNYASATQHASRETAAAAATTAVSHTNDDLVLTLLTTISVCCY
jgi:hypothetical protein